MPPKFIISGGGTGGHIFPAIAIADELKRLRPDAEFLFVGAKGKMEMTKVPAAGYRIEGLWISGLQRRLTLDNLSFPFKVMKSLYRSRQILAEFRPDAVVGTGGYAGAPVLYAAARKGIPTLIQEPNAFAGLANKWVGRYVDKICVAFAGMSQYFPAHKLVVTGNPVRERLLDGAITTAPAPKILLMGGSGGAKSLNEAMAASTEMIRARPQAPWLWQCGQAYHEAYRGCATAQLPNVECVAFIDDMQTAYRESGIVIGRAGSTTIAEVQYLGKPTILVPSPWVAEDHQTVNALALTKENAAILLPDDQTKTGLVPTVFELLDDDARRQTLGENARRLAQPGAAARIAQEVLNLISSPSPSNLDRATD